MSNDNDVLNASHNVVNGANDNNADALMPPPIMSSLRNRNRRSSRSTRSSHSARSAVCVEVRDVADNDANNNNSNVSEASDNSQMGDNEGNGSNGGNVDNINNVDNGGNVDGEDGNNGDNGAIGDNNGNGDGNDVANCNAVEGNSVAVAVVRTGEVVDVKDYSAGPSRKRRLVDEELPSTSNHSESDVDDTLCTICFESWEMNGPHRICALKCGHLYGESCIRRWINESARNLRTKVCPQCKAKASIRDIRHLYAKSIKVKDRSEERKLEEQLEIECERRSQMELTLYSVQDVNKNALLKIKNLEAENQLLKSVLERHNIDYSCCDGDNDEELSTYKLNLEFNIEIARNAGSRVMVFSKNSNQIIASQKSCQSLFPGCGVRFIDLNTNKAANFLFTCNKMLRDLCLSHKEELMVIASMETRSKMYDLRTKHIVKQFSVQEKPIWSCAMGCEDNCNSLYFGTQGGNIYSFDIRNPSTFADTYGDTRDISPVISIISIPITENVPKGGILVCRLTSLWFYEAGTVGGRSNRLHVEGPFISVNYNSEQQTVLVTTRSCAVYPDIRYIIGNLELVQNEIIFVTKCVFFGSKQAPLLVRSTQIPVNRNTLVAAYQQDSHVLNIYDVRRQKLTQSVHVNDMVFDTCPIQFQNKTFVAALSDNRCRIFSIK